MRRFFVDIPSLDVDFISLPEEESKHISRVLRLKSGDEIEIVNGKGGIFCGKIVESQPKVVVVSKSSYIQLPEKKHHVHIAIAPTKSNDRFEWFLEKATELGIDEITPLLCDNSERKVINSERFEKIIIAAVKQSQRIFRPILNPLTKFNDFIAQYPKGLIAHCYDDDSKNKTIMQFTSIHPKLWIQEKIPVLIGPEGDFSIKEVEKAIESGYEAVTLGNTRLRTETAGIFACTNLKIIFEE